MTLHWRKAGASGTSNCVEVAADGETVHVRDSKNPDGATLTFDPSEWVEFLDRMRRYGGGPEGFRPPRGEGEG